MEIIILITLLVIASETTYLAARSFNRTGKANLAPVFVDTSVLIDGRIISVAESGFLTRPLYIPRSVVGELQFLADNGDTEKRTRARHGLDVISQLQAIPGIKTVIFPDGVKADEGVDNRLLKLAKEHKGSLCTIDYNLNKVAVVEGIEVLNVNELTKSLRMAYLPGEHIRIMITQKGNDSHQGVGHLEDGTMVVVENAGKYVGKDVEVEFIRSLQTAAVKMMFSKLVQTVRSQSESGSGSSKPKVKPLAKLAHPSRSVPKPKVGVTPSSPAPQPKKPKPARSTAAAKPAGGTEANSRSQRPSSSRRKSPQDSLMELVNKS